jgi:hypothetical protein
MFAEIPAHVLNDSVPLRIIPLGTDPAYRTSIYNATTV